MVAQHHTDDYASDSQVPICSTCITVILMPSLYIVMLISVPGKDHVPINIGFCTSVALGSWFNTDG